ncbi:MAG: phosphatidate cytidylyltransferase [bacterium]
MSLEKFGVRALVTIIFGPFILFCAWKGGYVFLTLMLSIVVLGLLEFYDLSVQKVTNPQRIVGTAFGVLLCLLLFFYQLEFLWLYLTAAFIVMFLLELFRNQVAPILNVATTIMGLVYVALFLGFLILIRELPGQMQRDYQLGGYLVMLIFLSTWFCDSAAYILGSRLGKHKLFERVSPNKTVEGTVFGLLFAIFTAYLCHWLFLDQLQLAAVLVIGAICGSVGQLSDLLESLFKRDARVKDSSSLIPGHGGILDRFDSEIIIAPVVYIFLRFVVL